MRIDTEGFCIARRGKISLRDHPTRTRPLFGSKADAEKMLQSHVETLSDLQDRLYAAGDRSVLVILQALDAAGKDGAIKHVMSGVNPQGCQVSSFKHPGPVELQHDFLWRFVREMPERGRIGIFNRSYYEEVLIARVHPEILVNEERTPPTADPEAVFEGRYKSIRRLEKHLHRNGAKVVKIFLHLSREEQRQRFLARIEQPGKSWKLSLSDMQERRFWPQYQEAYEKAIGATASKSAPWWVVPADDKESARLIVSQILVDALTALDPQPPKETAERKGLLQAFKTELEAEAAG